MSIPAQVHAVGIVAHGDLDVIQDLQIPTPKPAPTEVLIKVSYAGVNFRDTYVRSGLYPEKAFPIPLGLEASGSIVTLPTDPAVLSNPDYQKLNLSVGKRIIALQSKSFSEYMTLPWNKAYPIPDFVSDSHAVAAMIQGTTALTFMTEAYNVQKDDWVPVHTVAGGLGLMLAQIAKSRGAHVIGTTSSPAKAELAKQNGAEHVILYTQEDTVKKVLELTGGKGVAAIFDGVGKDTWENNFPMIARKGTIVSIGNASGAVPPFQPLKLAEKNVKVLRPSVFGYIATPQESDFYLSQMWDLLKSGTIKPKIFKEYPFTAEGVKESQKDIVGRGTSGKLVIKVA